MISIKLILDKRKSKKDNSYPLKFQIVFNRKTTTRALGLSVKEEDWDDNNKQIKKSNPSYKTLNTRLTKDLADLQSKLLLTDEKAVQEFLHPVKEKLVIVKAKETLYGFVDRLIIKLKEEGKFGNAWVYDWRF